MERKVNLGRRKIKMNMIPEADARQVAFSRRRSGLFKKASELCTLCDAEAALIVFSPSGKAFSFGHPFVNSVIKKFLTQYPIPNVGEQQSAQAQFESSVRNLNKQYNDLLDQLAAEKKRGDMLKQMLRNQKACWWEAPIDELSLNELLTFKVLLEEVQKNVAEQGVGHLINASQTFLLGRKSVESNEHSVKE
ncbi:agamous-like MADS-box protein AGL29 [Malania oleifera]|uniref:agamous-like MADS-box protein AGL29 n=1 Tax=Malania oleifera TaxID=397392 RepID=UPI0025ADCF4E|nr:agamous-like MADS-box protein AGL29 [Malania oleifera]